MYGLLNPEVVTWTLTDNVEPVYVRLGSPPILERHLKAITRNASRLILIAGAFADTSNTLRLRMGRPTDVSAGDRVRDQRVQRAA